MEEAKPVSSTGPLISEQSRNWLPPLIQTSQSIRQIESEDYAKTVPFDSTIDLIYRMAQRYPDDPALLYQSEARLESKLLTLTYSELADQVARAATLFRAAGASRDAPVALIAPNIPSAHVALWGAQLASCVFPI